jgi:zinc transporter ZupT
VPERAAAPGPSGNQVSAAGMVTAVAVTLAIIIHKLSESELVALVTYSDRPRAPDRLLDG